jgi:hypothetical protein
MSTEKTPPGHAVARVQPVAPRPKQKLRGIAIDPSLRWPARGPKKGAANAGRPRDEWKAWLRTLVDSPTTRASIEQVLHDPQHPAFARVLSWADERGFGKEVTPIEATVTELVVVRRDESAQGRGSGAA